MCQKPPETVLTYHMHNNHYYVVTHYIIVLHEQKLLPPPDPFSPQASIMRQKYKINEYNFRNMLFQLFIHVSSLHVFTNTNLTMTDYIHNVTRYVHTTQ